MNNKSKLVLLEIKNIIVIFIGAAIAAIGANQFYAPQKFVGGGISGISVILKHMVDMEISTSLLIMNITLFIAAALLLGFKSLYKAAIGTVAYILMNKIFENLPALVFEEGEQKVLAAVFGGALDGIGLALVFVAGSNTGGSDILARILQKLFPHVGVGSIIFGLNVAIIGVSFICFKDITLTLYGVMLSFISSLIIDTVIEKLNISKIAFIITENPEEITNKVLYEMERGVTVLDAKGAYNNGDKKVLMCAMKDNEMTVLQKHIAQVDPGAFTIFSEAKQIHGDGFKIYK